MEQTFFPIFPCRWGAPATQRLWERRWWKKKLIFAMWAPMRAACENWHLLSHYAFSGRWMWLVFVCVTVNFSSLSCVCVCECAKPSGKQVQEQINKVRQSRWQTQLEVHRDTLRMLSNAFLTSNRSLHFPVTVLSRTLQVSPLGCSNFLKRKLLVFIFTWIISCFLWLYVWKKAFLFMSEYLIYLCRLCFCPS